MSLPELKQRLIELAAATDMRFEATKEEEQEIQALAAEVEKLNPTPDPARRADLLDGRWRLLYSSFRLTREASLGRLSFGKLPEVTVRVEGIYQEVDTAGGHYNNLVHFAHGDTKGVQVTKGRFEPADGTRLSIAFYAADARPADRAVAPAAFATSLGTAPDRLEAPLDAPGLWSDVVYLDDDLRLNRGAYRNLYVLVRDPAPVVSF
jgi:hypothetical protein